MKLVAMLMLPLAACSLGGNSDEGVPPSGTGTTRTYPVTGFTGVELAGADDVDVRVGTGFSVRAEGPTDELDRLRIEKKGDTLEIGRKNHTGISWGHGKVKVYVTLPRLTGASVAGSGTMAVDRVEGGKFAGSIAGSGTLNLAALAVDEATFDIAGSGDARAAGTAQALAVSIAGSGSLAGTGLRASRADVSIAGSGDVTAAVNGPAKIDLMGSGDVDLGPSARCQVSKMGSGKVRCGG